MLEHAYTYRDTLAASQRVNWRVEDIIGPDKPLDFSRPFLPESLVRARPLELSSDRETLLLNQIRGHAYLCIFGLVEEFILPFVVDHARSHLHGDSFRTRALRSELMLREMLRKAFRAPAPVPSNVTAEAASIPRLSASFTASWLAPKNRNRQSPWARW